MPRRTKRDIQKEWWRQNYMRCANLGGRADIAASKWCLNSDPPEGYIPSAGVRSVLKELHTIIGEAQRLVTAIEILHNKQLNRGVKRND